MLRRRGVIEPEQERLAKSRQFLLAAIELSFENKSPRHRNLTMTGVCRLVEAGGFAVEYVEDSLKAIRREDDLGSPAYNALAVLASWYAGRQDLAVASVFGSKGGGVFAQRARPWFAVCDLNKVQRRLAGIGLGW